MLLAWTVIDVALLAFYLLAMLLVGCYFSRQQRDSRDFFLAGRGLGGLPVGLSLLATLVTGTVFLDAPGVAYHVGLIVLLAPLAVWLTVPLMLSIVLPLYWRLQLVSVYEYLEYRFSLAVRLCASGLFIAWRLIWLGAVLYAPCYLLTLATGREAWLAPLVVTLGVVVTAYTWLGGLKAVIWTDVFQTLLMFLGLGIVIGGVWHALDGGPREVWQVAKQFGRVDLSAWSAASGNSTGRSAWLALGLLPVGFFLALALAVADQLTAQRYFATRTLTDARRSYVWGCVALTLFAPLLVYAGVALLAFYQRNPQAMNPRWVASVSDELEGAQTLIDPETNRLLFAKAENVERDLDRLIAVRAILDPNTGQPLEDRTLVTDAEGKLVIERLAKRDPRHGEVLLLRGQSELLPRFVETSLPSGLAGLVWVAILAAVMSSLDSGLNAVAGLLTHDFAFRLSGLRARVARWRGKEAHQLDAQDELWLGRHGVIAVGALATLVGLAFAWSGEGLPVALLNVLFLMLGALSGPLLAVFLLGIFSRRATARGALMALAVGIPATLWLALAGPWGLESGATPLTLLWPLILSTPLAALVGLLASWTGRATPPGQLVGLVWGLGKLGQRPVELEEAQDEGE